MSPTVTTGHWGKRSVLRDEWLSERDAAAEIGKSVRTLRTWRRKGEGSPYAHFGRSIKYNRQALIEHFNSLVVQPVRSRKSRTVISDRRA
jgi:hypothetical protein